MSTPPTGLLKRPARVFYGWWIVVIGVIVDAVTHGTFQRGFSVYFLHIQPELSISRAAYSMADLLGRLEAGILGPGIGYLIDRLGAGTLMFVGGLLLGVGFISLSFVHSYLYFMLVFVGLLSLGVRIGSNNACIPAINQWFRRKRTLAMSIVYSGQGMGGTVITPILGLMVVGLGWRTSAVICGIAVLCIVVPLSLLVRRSPESMGLMPDGDRIVPPQPLPGPGQRGRDEMGLELSAPAKGSDPGSQESVGWDFTTIEALRTPSFWLFVLALGLRDSVHAGYQWHMVPLMVWSGVSLTTAAFFVGLMSLTSVLFAPCMGWAGDRWSKQRISAASMASAALAMLVLMASSGQLWQLTIFVILLALADTVMPINWSLLGEFFGRKNFATLAGWYRVPSTMMVMWAPVWVGWVFDRTDSYFWALVPLIVISVVSGFFYWIMPSPKIPARAPRAAGPQHP